MRATRTWLVAVAVALQSLGCGADHMGGRNVASLSENIQAARTEVTRHGDAITNAQSMAAIPTEVDRYETTMHDILSGMSSTMGGMMSHCSGSGMGTMHGMMGNVTTELASHRTVMTAETDLADARTACTAHAQRVDGMFDGMQGALGQMGCMMGY
jgi:hypothetical protein